MVNAPPLTLRNARLPRWLLAGLGISAEAALARIEIAAGRIAAITAEPCAHPPAAGAQVWDLQGALVLPALVDAHLHLDKAFTLERMGEVRPGLLAAIDAMMADRAHWTPADVRRRAEQGLQWAWEAGVAHARSHCDWWEPDAVPVAWNVLGALAQEWAGRLTLERVSLVPLHLYEDRATALRLAAQVAAGGGGALLGGFVHSSNWSAPALRNLLEAAQRHGLDVDLHVDEELNPAAQGLATTAALLRELRFGGRVVCGHNCALAAQPPDQALRTLDAVAQAPITLVTLPVTNLLLQDAQTGRTPRQRGLTLVKEARARGIPVLVASDNVQDPFCPLGSFDPLEALATGVAAAQLHPAFDAWSDSVCRADWLGGGAQLPLQAGAAADLVLFPQAGACGFPSRSQRRVVVRAGRVRHGEPPASWLTPCTERSTA
ncbi:MAG: amidohydrolase family protein [Acidovorax sp.]